MPHREAPPSFKCPDLLSLPTWKGNLTLTVLNLPSSSHERPRWRLTVSDMQSKHRFAACLLQEAGLQAEKRATGRGPGSQLSVMINEEVEPHTRPLL